MNKRCKDFGRRPNEEIVCYNKRILEVTDNFVVFPNLFESYLTVSPTVTTCPYAFLALREVIRTNGNGIVSTNRFAQRHVAGVSVAVDIFLEMLSFELEFCVLLNIVALYEVVTTNGNEIVDSALRVLAGATNGKRRRQDAVVFNSLSFERTELVDCAGYEVKSDFVQKSQDQQLCTFTGLVSKRLQMKQLPD